MRERVRRAALWAALLALLVFGVPLGVTVYQVYQDQERGELVREAVRGAAAISPEELDAQARIRAPATEPDTQLGLYPRSGNRAGGTGPGRADAAVAGALAGRLTETVGSRALVVAVPVRDANQVVGAVRASSATGSVWQRTLLTWLLMAALAGVAGGVAAVLADRQAARLARPLTELAATAQALGDGDFTARAPRSGIGEIDAAAAALDDTATRLDALLTRERSFSAAASHQLRTPLTQVRLLLETGLVGDPAGLRQATEQALAATDRLEQTIEELLEIARPDPSGNRPLDVLELVEGFGRERAGPLGAAGRTLSLEIGDGLPAVNASAAGVRQILGVLVDNAIEHGGGTITIRARNAGHVLALDVLDEGNGPGDEVDLFERSGPRASGRGLGLPLARALAEADGGRLVVTGTDGQTAFTLLLPAGGAPGHGPEGTTRVAETG